MPKTMIEIISEDICVLNCWATPKRLKTHLGRELTGEEIRLVMNVLENYAPYSRWILTWQRNKMLKVITSGPNPLIKDPA